MNHWQQLFFFLSSNLKQYNIYFQLDFKRDICLRRLNALLKEIWRNSCSTVAAGYRNHLSQRLVKKESSGGDLAFSVLDLPSRHNKCDIAGHMCSLHFHIPHDSIGKILSMAVKAMRSTFHLCRIKEM